MPRCIYVADDEKSICFLIMNVISNCIRYARTQVRVAVRDEPGNVLILAEDDGPGILSADLAHLFDRFYKGKDGNHGLGLALAKSSLEYMGGTIRAGSSSAGLPSAFPVSR